MSNKRKSEKTTYAERHLTRKALKWWEDYWRGYKDPPRFDSRDNPELVQAKCEDIGTITRGGNRAERRRFGKDLDSAVRACGIPVQPRWVP